MGVLVGILAVFYVFPIFDYFIFRLELSKQYLQVITQTKINGLREKDEEIKHHPIGFIYQEPEDESEIEFGEIELKDV